MCEIVPSDLFPWSVSEREIIVRTEPFIRRLALEKRVEEAFHYDGFLVGAGGVGMTPAGPRLFWGSNYKDRPGTLGPRVCGEDDLEAHAFCRGCTHLLKISIAATFKSDDSSGGHIENCTIPCIYCRRRFIKSIRNEGIIRRETIFESMRLEERDGELVVAHIAKTTVGGILDLFPTDP